MDSFVPTRRTLRRLRANYTVSSECFFFLFFLFFAFLLLRSSLSPDVAFLAGRALLFCNQSRYTSRRFIKNRWLDKSVHTRPRRLCRYYIFLSRISKLSYASRTRARARARHGCHAIDRNWINLTRCACIFFSFFFPSQRHSYARVAVSAAFRALAGSRNRLIAPIEPDEEDAAIFRCKNRCRAIVLCSFQMDALNGPRVKIPLGGHSSLLLLLPADVSFVTTLAMENGSRRF